ncbi:MAG: hypothetical protein WCI57_00025 [Candidatus Berkelbacteria bacterium]
MDYGKIIGRAWEITKKYRWLWWLGLLALCAEGSMSSPGSFFGSGNGGSSTDQGTNGDLFQRFLPATPVSGDKSASIFNIFPKIHASSSDVLSKYQIPDDMKWAGQFLLDHIWTGVAILLVMLIIWLVILYVSYSAKAGLILSVKSLETSNKELGFKKAYHEGREFVWKLFGQDLIIGLSVMLGVSALVFLCFLPWLLSHTESSILYGILLGVILVLPAIVASLYISILIKVSSRAIVIDKMGIFDSLSHVHTMVRKNLGNSIVLWLIQVGIAIVVSFIMMLFVFVVVIIMILAGIIAAIASPVAGVVVGCILAVVMLGGVYLALSIFNTFLSSYWTISYRALSYLAAKKK